MIKFNIKILVSCLLVLMWMAVIFLLSAQDGTSSGDLSHAFTDWLLSFLRAMLPNSIFESIDWHFLMRKSAHFLAYFILSLLIFNATQLSSFSKKNAILFTLIISILYAISDEIHQMFVPGRGPAVKDVLIDSSGAILGIVIYLLLSKMFRKRTKSE